MKKTATILGVLLAVILCWLGYSRYIVSEPLPSSPSQAGRTGESSNAATKPSKYALPESLADAYRTLVDTTSAREDKIDAELLLRGNLEIESVEAIMIKACHDGLLSSAQDHGTLWTLLVEASPVAALNGLADSGLLRDLTDHPVLNAIRKNQAGLLRDIESYELLRTARLDAIAAAVNLHSGHSISFAGIHTLFRVALQADRDSEERKQLAKLIFTKASLSEMEYADLVFALRSMNEIRDSEMRGLANYIVEAFTAGPLAERAKIFYSHFTQGAN